MELTKEKLEVAKEQLDTTKEQLDKKNELILNIAKKLKADGASNENIQALTGLSSEEVNEL